MRYRSLLLGMVVALGSFGWAQAGQETAPKTPTSGMPAGKPMNAEQHQKMMEMHKQHLAAARADLEKMKASLEQMKSNAAQISDSAEKARWQNNIDLWTTMIGHMEQMLNAMEHGGMGMMGPGMHHMQAPPPPKPE